MKNENLSPDAAAKAAPSKAPLATPPPSTSAASGVPVWRLKKGMDRRFRSGHPWVYSNELDSSPKGIEPGAPVELRDAGGQFLARGYGNPSSLISFRALSRKPEEVAPWSPEGVLARLREAAAIRNSLGLSGVSHRLCFGEADQLPGLIIDRYRLEAAHPAQAFVIQAHTAGADRLLPQVRLALDQLVSESDIPHERSAIVLRNDVGMRTLDGLTESEVETLRPAKGVDLAKARIRMAPSTGNDPIIFEADLLKGQKTGFFLDQSANTRQFANIWKPTGKETIRILDLCCYAGQWSSQLARAFQARGNQVEVTLFDASASALEIAKRNVGAQGVQKVTTVQGDVLKDLNQFQAESFDLVISDPPALIKGRKNIAAGTHAYLQVNTQAFRVVKTGGAVICSSCSFLLDDESFLQTLSKAAVRNDRRVRWVSRGGQAGDHPVLAEFPEGRYLKAWMGVVR